MQKEVLEHYVGWRRRGESESRLNQSSFRQLLEKLPAAVYMCDAAGLITYYNRHAVELWGRAPKLNDPVDRFCGSYKLLSSDGIPIAHEQCWMAKALAMDKEFDGEEILVEREDGTRATVLAHASPLRDETGKLFGAVNILVDISDQKRAESALVSDLVRVKETQAALREREAELRTLNETLEKRVQERTAEADARSRQLRALALDLADTESRERKRLAQLLHDHFQQLVSAAKLKTGLVRRNITDSKTIETLKQAENLLEEALSASRTLATELSPPVLNDAGLIAALEWLSRKMEADYGLRVSVTSEPAAEPESERVRTLLFECARELLFNVVKHAQTKEASLALKMSPEGLLSLTVADRGRGFDSFEFNADRRKSETSFGLFSIRERLSFIGGLLNVRSAVGQGTKIKLSVPVGLPSKPISTYGNAQTAVSQNPPPLVAAQDRPARVLVADDHKLFREGVIHLLSQEPDLCVVGQASDGQEAVEFTRRLKPDILILDVSMPKLNGIHVAAQISRELPLTRIIGLSMYEDKDMAKAMRAAGAAAYLSKGGSSEKLIDIVRSLTSVRIAPE
jgi:signal transduction histidine kinase/ActR/RegA family two-component response regulator